MTVNEAMERFVELLKECTPAEQQQALATVAVALAPPVSAYADCSDDEILAEIDRRLQLTQLPRRGRCPPRGTTLVSSTGTTLVSSYPAARCSTSRCSPHSAPRTARCAACSCRWSSGGPTNP